MRFGRGVEQAFGLHLEFDEAESAVIVHDDLEGYVLLLLRDG
jgi:hypothetical protein